MYNSVNTVQDLQSFISNELYIPYLSNMNYDMSYISKMFSSYSYRKLCSMYEIKERNANG